MINRSVTREPTLSHRLLEKSHFRVLIMHFYIFRDIATAIKDLLDAVNEVFKNCQSVGKMAQYKEVNSILPYFTLQ